MKSTIPLKRLLEILATLGDHVSDVEVEIVNWAQSHDTGLICGESVNTGQAFAELSLAHKARNDERARLRKRLTNQRRELRRLAKRELELLDKTIMQQQLIDALRGRSL